MKHAIVLAVCSIYSLCSQLTLGHAMQFRIFHQPEENEDVIIGEGPIVRGDAERLAAISNHGSRDKFGNLVFVLNSPGGDVSEAFRIVDVMDHFKVTTIVPDNALCASACASILYISGTKHVVLGTGVIGFHSCYAVRSGVIVNPHDELCNEKIGTNSFLHGTDYALVDMFTHDYGPDKMRYINAHDACAIGLCDY